MKLLINIFDLYHQKETQTNIFYYDKTEMSDRELKYFETEKQKILKKIAKQANKEKICEKTLTKKGDYTELFSNGVFRWRTSKYESFNSFKETLTEETFVISEELLKKIDEQEAAEKKEKEKLEIQKLKKQMTPKREKKGFKIKELKWLLDEGTAELALMKTSGYLPAELKRKLADTLNKEKVMTLKLLMKVEKENGSYQELLEKLAVEELIATKEVRERVAKYNTEVDVHADSWRKNNIYIKQIALVLEKEKEILKILRNMPYDYYDYQTEAKIKKLLYSDEKRADFEHVATTKYFNVGSILQFYFFWPELFFFEHKFGLETKAEFIKMNEIMTDLREKVKVNKSIDVVLVGVDNVLGKKKIDFIMEKTYEK